MRSCNQLLRELGDGSHVDEMMEVFQVMQLAGLQPTQVTYGTLISRAGSAREPVLAAQCFRDMLRRGLQPDVQTFNSLINAFAKVSSTPKRVPLQDLRVLCASQIGRASSSILTGSCTRVSHGAPLDSLAGW